ncbi:hypothetical protein [Flavobacterium luteum]|uniref:DUF3379 domain-containing protein n=1 Tax=Flavobacterium luteum TaxID=2026654 RepID=A0A7J5AFC9_9FLAO|nr:hypothetical protein [Flavobacterium luteum]KAB1156291.1 hypothetical protein F6464_08860 [Flavobacterium luteum]
MEFSKIETLLEKYFQGDTSIAEENELKKYFSSPNVLPHLEQYKSLFGYFTQAKQQEFNHLIPLKSKKQNLNWLSIAASVVVMLGIGMYVYLNTNTSQNQDLGTYDNPEIAFKETQKALALLSNHVNVGIESVHYVEEYQNSKNLIFKP